MSSVVVPRSAVERNGEGVTCRVQHLPCRVEHRGPANIDVYFTPLVCETAPGVLEGQFRGHPLDGITVEVPAGYEGIVAREEKGTDGTTYVATERFRRFTTWNWDRQPSSAAPLWDWLDVANVLHSTAEQDN
ncbi:ribonuclease H2 subunit C-like [Pollicipes pollicipes]|uniref:ribonuclease H2 subunit C-like n=1 Tax=Pollicipes pollicipes TaxID=41117 RepID=UPI001884FF19|nr:ribonuclease H2 subunit C-like [Pollicipes pollicipes]XP_037090409.1 ribonuclease H2 subunit C-like [Pollicipes pollicipes]